MLESIYDRFYYFFRNLLAFVMGLPFQFIFVCWQILIAFVHLFVTNGSILICFPWQYDWMGFKNLDKEEDEKPVDDRKLTNESKPNKVEFHYIIKKLIKSIGDCPNREGLKETPIRVQRSMSTLFSGYEMTEENICRMMKTFRTVRKNCDQIILVKNIEMYSTCEHHLLPFFGVAHIAYIPDGDRVVGASKLPRLLEAYSRRLQIQEDIGEQVTNAIMKYLKPKGAACIIEAKHMCMMARGVQKQNSTMITSSLKGVFIEKPEPRQELMELLK